MPDPETDLTVERTIDKPVDAVWSLWTEPEGLSQWWWSARFGTRYSVDLKTGRGYRFVTEDMPGMGVLELSGTFLEATKPSRLRYTWVWAADPEEESVVDVTFAGTGPERTLVTVRHQGLKDTEDRDNHIIGWNDCLDRLEALGAL